MSDDQTIPGLLGPSVPYVDLIDAAIYESQDKEAAEKKRMFYPLRPSAAGYCERKLAFDLDEYVNGTVYEKEPKSADLERLFDLGHGVEYSMIKFMRRAPYWQVRYTQQVVSFFKLPCGRMVEGSLDFCLISDEFKVIGDVKSKGDKFSSWTDSKWHEDNAKYARMKTVKALSDRSFWVEDPVAFIAELNDPFTADNMVQLNGYGMTQFIQERGINHGMLLYYNKNKSMLREIRFKLSQELFEQVRQRFIGAHNAVYVEKDPLAAKREYALGSMRCAFCDYKKLCWGEANDARKEYFATFPKKQWPRDTDRLKEAEHFEALYQEWLAAQGRETSADVIEEKLCHALHEAGVNKVRFSDKAVYELKLLKSPRPHFELRKAKP